MNDKLTIQELAAYLPWEVEMIFEGKRGRRGILQTIGTSKFGDTISIGTGGMWLKSCGFKPLLLPLSSLTKEIEHKGEKFVPSIEYSYLRFEEISTYKGGSNVLKFIQVREHDVLLELHFDIFGLLDRGLAVDKTTIQ